MTVVLIPGPQYAPKVKYFPVTITILISTPVNSESSSRESSRPSSPESGNLTTRMLYSTLPEMAIVHRSMHDAIHAVREQHGRAVSRNLLTK